jgi:single-strand DNA-binding protein
MSSINRVVLVGNLTRDPELRALPSGASVCHLRIACNGLRRNAEGGYDEKPNYFDVSVFGAPAENAQRYLYRGRPVAIDGRLEWREWESTEGQRRQAVSVVADSLQFLGSPDGARSVSVAAGLGGDSDDETGNEPIGVATGDADADDLAF